MTTKAKVFIGLTIACGVTLLATCLAGEGPAHSSAYLAFCLLALPASALKVRLPGIKGNISVNFVFVLISVAMFTFSETVILTAAACLVQSVWKKKSRPKVVQVSFNVGTLAIASGLSYRLSHMIGGAIGIHMGALLVIAACTYFTANTLLVSGVLSLVESKSLFRVWEQCYLWSFPYYLAGAAIAGLVVNTSRAAGWTTSLLLLPSMYLVYVFYRLCVGRLAPETPRSAAA